jgi:hypothetical protein
MSLQFKDIATGEVKFVNEAQRLYETYQAGDYKKSMSELYNQMKTLPLGIEELQFFKLQQLKEECSRVIYEGFVAPNTHIYGFNDLDQANFTQQMLLILQGSPGPFNWKTKDAGVVSHTLAEFQEVIGAAAGHKQVQQTHFWELEQALYQTQSKEEIDRIDW